VVGLALEGGGSRGAYHIGVVKAYLKAGYNFTGFVGTSIGAINAAVFAQGDFAKAEEMWTGLSTEQLFDADSYKFLRLGEFDWNMEVLADARKGLISLIKTHGVDTSRMWEFLEKNISEDRVRASGFDYGLVTVSIYERKPYELYIEDIKQGELLSYIAASACVPGFKSVVIGNNSFIDGGFYNGCPVSMLIRKGYKEIIVVRTKYGGVYRRFYKPKDVIVRVITPKHDLGNPMIFSPDKIAENIFTGYVDGIKALRKSNRY